MAEETHEAAATVEVRAAHDRVNRLLLVPRSNARGLVDMVPWTGGASVSVERRVVASRLLAPYPGSNHMP